MKLRDLDAEFLGRYRNQNGRISYRRQASIKGAQGVRFQCPRCAQGKPVEEEDGRRFVRGVHSLICWFRNPRGAEPVPVDADPKPGRWWAEGTSIDDLTFTPGDPPTAHSIQLNGGCNWHGYVANGDAT